jgi:hypothetical protein
VVVLVRGSAARMGSALSESESEGAARVEGLRRENWGLVVVGREEDDDMVD